MLVITFYRLIHVVSGEQIIYFILYFDTKVLTYALYLQYWLWFRFHKYSNMYLKFNILINVLVTEK